jgi:AraC-like DNA-binding protein
MKTSAESTHGILEPTTGRAHFVLERRAPAPGLEPWVERHWTVRWELGEGSFEQEVLPHPSVNLSSEPGLIAVYGIPLGRSPHRIEGSGMVVGTKFKPGGFAAWSRIPVADLGNRRVPLGEALGASGRRLERGLAAVAGDAGAHIELVEDYLSARLPDPDPRYELVSEVVAEMLSAAPGTTVAELAERHAVSPRNLQRLFREYVGVGPKWVLKRYRVHEAAERIAAGEVEDGAALAADLGYADQSHFIADFSAQVGRSPGEYARACAAAAGREPALAA